MTNSGDAGDDAHCLALRLNWLLDSVEFHFEQKAGYFEAVDMRSLSEFDCLLTSAC